MVSLVVPDSTPKLIDIYPHVGDTTICFRENFTSHQSDQFYLHLHEDLSEWHPKTLSDIEPLMAVSKAWKSLCQKSTSPSLVKITHSGLCGTDVAVMPYGLALGHEGVGTVAEVGSRVESFHVGDRVGSGYQRDSCGNCKYCLSGNEIWCLERNIYAEKDFQKGTFSQYYVAAESFVYRIPDNMSSEAAAPLQCAGATVYSALVNNIKLGDRVGILGIGGLGHLAIQFASKLGAEVVVFSTSASKEEEAKKFGASEFVLLSKPDEVKAPLDVLLLSGNQYPDFEAFCNPKVLARQAIISYLLVLHMATSSFLDCLYSLTATSCIRVLSPIGSTTPKCWTLPPAKGSSPPSRDSI